MPAVGSPASGEKLVILRIEFQCIAWRAHAHVFSQARFAVAHAKSVGHRKIFCPSSIVRGDLLYERDLQEFRRDPLARASIGGGSSSFRMSGLNAHQRSQPTNRTTRGSWIAFTMRSCATWHLGTTPTAMVPVECAWWPPAQGLPMNVCVTCMSWAEISG